ncbi:MAG: glycosyltransferase, partial [Halothiobacillaceae bacterium]
VVSNFNRKDTGSAIRAYVRAFSRRSDTTLVIKVPPKITESEIQKFFHDAVFPEVDLTDESLPHILVLSANLSDEEMWALYKQVDCTLVTERAKGFDLVSAEAMSAGCPAVAVGWGANLEFMTPQNSYLLKPQQELVPVDPTLIVNEQLYGTGMWSTFDIEDAAMALVDIHARRGAALERARRAQKDVQALLGRDNVARQMINSLRARRVWETAGFKEPRVRIWAKGRDRVTELSALRQLPFEKLNAEERALFKRSPKESAVDYIEKRRPLWGKYGCVLPPAAERERIRGLKDRHLGKSIFVMGNGPSLKLIDFDDLIGVPTFAANRISLAFDRTAWRPTFFTALDWLVSPDNHEEYDALPETITRFIPMRFHGLMAETPSTYWYESTSAGMHGAAKFQGDATQAIRGAGTVVTGMLQLAWHLGFRQFYLLGCNASYKVLDTVKQSGGDRFGTGVQVKLESTQDDDPNHFDPRYFGAGKKWHDPNVDEMMRGFRNCQLAIERMGGKLIDCTEGGKLEFLPRMRFEAALELVRTEGGI